MAFSSQGSVNCDHNKILYSSVLVRMYINVVRVYIGTVTLENNLALSYKLEHSHLLWSSSSNPTYTPNRSTVPHLSTMKLRTRILETRWLIIAKLWYPNIHIHWDGKIKSWYSPTFGDHGSSVYKMF